MSPSSLGNRSLGNRSLGRSHPRSLWGCLLVLSSGLGGCQGPALWGNLALVALTVGIFLSTLTLRK